MRAYHTQNGTILEFEGTFYTSDLSWNELSRSENPRQLALESIDHSAPAPNPLDQPQSLLPPIGKQEVWASGVTYMRSRSARMEEAKEAGGGTFYDRVYEASRPELFFKAPYYRVSGHGGNVRIRRDSGWDVPEPELTLLLSPTGRITGYTIGNDMSSRSIEGENPLYLPQAKTYDGAAALGPCLYLPDGALPVETEIRIAIRRAEQLAFEGSTDLGQIRRGFEELASWLFRELTFPEGCLLMTGTGVVPPNDFTLQAGDEIRITIPPIGTLVNTVAAD